MQRRGIRAALSQYPGKLSFRPFTHRFIHSPLSRLVAAVAVPTPLHRLFDYSLPNSLQNLLPGSRVRVPFGRREMIGVVMHAPRPAEPDGRYRELLEVLDEVPLVPPELLGLLRRVAEYYQYPPGEVMAAALPGPLRRAQALRPRAIKLVERSETPPTLTAEQARALTELETGSGFDPVLLEGVTGSGKTELYLRRIAAALEGGAQALLLVPEIGLVPQLLERVRARFGAGITSFHSGMTEAARAQAWLAAREGRARVVVGTRSAVLLPFARLGLIVVDEEHDTAYKQQEGLRYSARDVALLRAQRARIGVLLGSATPALETLHQAQQGRYRHVRLASRVKQAAPPRIQLLNLRSQPLVHGLSRSLLEALGRNLERGGQSLLFLNRRGYAPVWLCHDCGWNAPCTECDARLTVHRAQGRLICHHCGTQQALPKTCPSCHSSSLVAVGMGTERIEDALRNQFPGVRVERLDSDRARKAGELERLLTDIRERRIQILVGTQMLAKGHDFAGLSLVGIVSADQALYGADFRAVERMGQLITQVAGRAGRGVEAGEVWLQTHEPDHPLLTTLTERGYGALCSALLTERREAGLPPYSYLALLRAEAEDAAAPLRFLTRASELLREGGDVQVGAPLPALMERRAGRVRAQLLLQSPKRPPLQALLAAQLPLIEALPEARRLRWSVDVDPYDLF